MTSPVIEPHLWVEDLPGAIAWYRAVLGFEVEAWYPDEDSATWCRLARGAARLMVAVTPPPRQIAQENQGYLGGVAERVAGPGGPHSLYLYVEDAAGAYERARAAGAEPLEPMWDPWWGGRQFTVADPAGTWWTVYQEEL